MTARHTATRLLTLFLLLGVTAACGVDTVEEVVTIENELEPTLEVLQADLFEPGCAMSGCHDASVRAGDLDLSTADATWNGLVNIPAENDVAFENRWLRVVPGDPDKSFLIRKLTEPGVGEGFAMPIGNQQLNDPWLELTRAWIAAGAPR